MFYQSRWYDPASGRFSQADTIVPGGVQGLDRYAYVNNSPLNYVDPSGHKACWATNHYTCNLTPEDIQKLYGTEEGTTFLRNLFGGVLPAVVVFCGDNGNVNLPNSQCPQQVPAWSTNPLGGEVYFIPYQGDKSITGDFATNTLNIPNDVPVIIIGYSAGAEPALIYAVDRISQGGKIQAVVLLGPTFSGADRNGTDLGFSSSSGGWKEYMDIISNYGGGT